MIFTQDGEKNDNIVSNTIVMGPVGGTLKRPLSACKWRPLEGWVN